MPCDHFFGEIRVSRHAKGNLHNAHSGPPVGCDGGEGGAVGPLPGLVYSGAWGAVVGQFLLVSFGPFSSLFTRLRGRPIGGEVFSHFPVIRFLPRRFAYGVASSVHGVALSRPGRPGP